MIATVGCIAAAVIPPIFKVQNTLFNASFYFCRKERLLLVQIYHAKQTIECKVIAITVRFDDGNYFSHLVHL